MWSVRHIAKEDGSESSVAQMAVPGNLTEMNENIRGVQASSDGELMLY